MLPKKNRLDLARDFRRFKNSPNVVESPFFRMVFVPTVGEPRFGFVVTNKTGGAVNRNRGRRIMREMVKERLDKMKGIEAVFIGRRKLTEANFEEVLASFDKNLSKIRFPR
jgi:ribonuclease P protein component